MSKMKTQSTKEWIEEWNEEHAEIASTFDELAPFARGELFPTGDLIGLLKRLKEQLTHHVQEEDDYLYPPLKEKGGEAVKDLIEASTIEMEKISVEISAFFDSFLHLEIKDLESDPKFREGLNTVTKLYTARMRAEEDVLFPLFEKYCSQ